METLFVIVVSILSIIVVTLVVKLNKAVSTVTASTVESVVEEKPAPRCCGDVEYAQLLDWNEKELAKAEFEEKKRLAKVRHNKLQRYCNPSDTQDMAFTICKKLVSVGVCSDNINIVEAVECPTENSLEVTISNEEDWVLIHEVLRFFQKEIRESGNIFTQPVGGKFTIGMY